MSWTSSAIRTSRSRPRSTGSSPTRSTPDGSCRAPGSPRSASSARPSGSTRTRSGPSTSGSPTPATSRAVTGPAPTSPTGRPSAAARRRSPGSSPRCSAARPRPGSPPTRSPRRHIAAATERKRPGPLVRVLFAECTKADASYDAERIAEAFPGSIEAEGTLLDEIPERLDRFHYDLDRDDDVPRRRGPGPRRRPGAGRGDARRARLHGPDPRDRGAAAGRPGRARLRIGASARTTSPRRSRSVGDDRRRDRLGHDRRRRASIAQVDRTADLILLSREALALGLDERFYRPERVREWLYEFDPSGLELLRRAIEHAQADRALAAAGSSA